MAINNNATNANPIASFGNNLDPLRQAELKAAFADEVWKHAFQDNPI
jgi:hypothetical protein